MLPTFKKNTPNIKPNKTLERREKVSTSDQHKYIQITIVKEDNKKYFFLWSLITERKGFYWMSNDYKMKHMCLFNIKKN